MQQLFPDNNEAKDDHNSYILQRANKPVRPLGKHERVNPAADLIRRKIDALYGSEPSALDELTESAHLKQPLSKHQQFMHDLSTSGKPLAHIQTEWHRYYASLPDAEKHEVWQEFYRASARHPSSYTKFVQQHAARPAPEAAHQKEPAAPWHHKHAAEKSAASLSEHSAPAHASKPKPGSTRTLAAVRSRVLSNVRSRSRARAQAKKHLHSILFGLGAGVLACVVLLFSFLNEVVIAPLIQPSGKASPTPIILSADGVAPSPNPEVIIPKINAQLPVVYGTNSSAEDAIQNALNSGVVHYPSTTLPGQQGNVAIFGHSSNNIFNPGKYKFAFVLLHELEPGDIFYLTYGSKVYSYRIFKKQVVEPTDTWVLNPVADKPATVTLITCDPPGTSRYRLVVWGEQVNPDPVQNQAAPAAPTPVEAEELPSEGPTLWTRLWRNLNPFD